MIWENWITLDKCLDFGVSCWTKSYGFPVYIHHRASQVPVVLLSARTYANYRSRLADRWDLWDCRHCMALHGMPRSEGCFVLTSMASCCIPGSLAEKVFAKFRQGNLGSLRCSSTIAWTRPLLFEASRGFRSGSAVAQ